MDLWSDEEASHTPARTTNLRAALLWMVLALAALVGCPSASVDDDDSAPLTDDDDSTPPPDPLADVLGVVNLTDVRQPEGTDYVDLAAAFGDFAAIDLELVSPTAYISTWGSDAPLWRLDLGSWPLPALGTETVIDLYDYVPWLPDEQVWWDAGDRVAVGPYLSRRFQDENVLGYQVDDPLSPGGAGWTAGGAVTLATSGGAHIIDWSSGPDGSLPEDMELLSPLPGSEVETPSAQQFTVEWTPKDDGAVVTLVLLQGLGVSYIAHVEDDGEHTIPASVLHDDLGSGVVELIASRMIESIIEHPQGDIVLRARSEERADLILLEDLVLEPSFGSAGQTVQVDARWFTGSIDGGTILDFGEGLTVDAVTPDDTDPQRATITVSIAPDAELGNRTVFVSNGGEFIEAPDAFTVMNLDPADDCAAADAQGPLPVGTYISTTDGLNNSLSSGYACFDWSLNGSDATYAVFMTEGVTMRIAATMPDPGDSALALLSSCGVPESAVACADTGFEGDTEEILFTPETTGIYYVAVDGYFLNGFGSPSSPFELTIEETIPPSPVNPAWIVAGETSVLEITGDGPWDGGIGPSDVDLGAGIFTTNAAASGTTLTVTASADGAAITGPRTVTVTNGGTGDVAMDAALFVTELPGNDSCTAADTWGETTFSGLEQVGWSANGSNTLDETGCFTWMSPGDEVVHALDLLTGQTLNATVLSSEDTQLYVVTDCTDVANTCISEASADDAFDGEEEFIFDWVVPADGRYYLVVDLYAAALTPSWEYALTVDVQ